MVLPLPIIASVLLITVVRLVLAIQLTTAVRRTGQRDLIWLIVYYFATFASDIFFNSNTLSRASFTVGSLQVPVFALLKYLFGGLGDVAMVMFIHHTFYRNRRSPYLLFIGSALIVSAIGIGVASFAPGINILNPFVWGWLILVAYPAYQPIAVDKYVEDWVKTRYKLMIAYGVMLATAALLLLVVIFLVGRGFQAVASAIIISVILISLVAIILQYLVWAMPEAFRKWLNRNQQAKLDQRVQEQTLAILDILVTSMSRDTGIGKTTAFYIIRKIISQEIKTEDSTKIEAHMITMGYDDWFALLTNPKWQNLIQDYDAKINPLELLEKAKQALIEKQSLLTMQIK